ncbi:hypothetical protein RI065_10100 [Mycoplasmatota bacterium zrk1]
MKERDKIIKKMVGDNKYSLDLHNFYPQLIRDSSYDYYFSKIQSGVRKTSGFLQMFKRKSGLRLTAVLDEKIKMKLKSGEYVLKNNKDGGTFVPCLYDKSGKIVKQIRLEEHELSTITNQAISNLQVQQQLSELAIKIEGIVNTVNRIESGQRNDRLGIALSARQIYLEATCLNDDDLRKQLLCKVISMDQEARYKLMLSLREDCIELRDNKILSKKEKNKLLQNIASDFRGINIITEEICSVYNLLGEKSSMIVTLESYEHFVKEILLSREGDNDSIAEILHQNSPNDTNEWIEIPKRVHEKTVKLIDFVNMDLVS